MNDRTKCKIKETLLSTLHSRLSETEFEFDEGRIQVTERDDNAIYLAFYPLDNGTEEIKTKPSHVWTIEVSVSNGEVA